VQRCLGTGHAGTIGSAIVSQPLVAGADEVSALDNVVRGRGENLANARASGAVQLIARDIRTRRLINVPHAERLPTGARHHPYDDATVPGVQKSAVKGCSAVLMQCAASLRGAP
jgi:nucleoside-diphosphate-sugar epimerase